MGRHRWFRNQFLPFFTVLHCPLGLGELQACPFPDVVFPPLPLSPCLLPPFTVPCKMVLVRPDERETWPNHCSLCLYTIARRSSRGPIAFRILARTFSFVTWSSYEMRSIFRWHLISKACILLWSSAVRVHDSQAYRKMDVTRDRISRILELREILLSFQTGFNLVNAAAVCAILESISGLEPSSVITEPRSWKLVAVSSFFLSIYFDLCSSARTTERSASSVTQAKPCWRSYWTDRSPKRRRSSLKNRQASELERAPQSRSLTYEASVRYISSTSKTSTMSS